MQTMFAILTSGRVESGCAPASWLSFLDDEASLPTGEGDRDRSRSRLGESVRLLLFPYGDGAVCVLRMPVLCASFLLICCGRRSVCNAYAGENII